MVATLLYDQLCTFEFAIAAEIFSLARPEFGADWYRFATVAIEPGPLRAQGGLTISATESTELLNTADIIIVPGWRGVDAPVPPQLVTQLITAHQRGARLASICSGVFVLAATGLLSGHRATTHWRYADALRKKHPDIVVDEASLYHCADRVYTSAGSAAGIDLMIEIIRQDYGPDAANSVARRIVMPAHRAGGQAQYLERPVARHANGNIAPLLDMIRQTLGQRWTIDRMAKQVAMSRRTFERRFVEATGQGPGEWLIAERVEAAKAILLQSPASIEDVALATGFGSAHTLRHHFRTHIQLTPAQYRSAFRTHSNAPQN